MAAKDAMFGEYVLITKETFGGMVSSNALFLERTHRIIWGEPSDFNDLDGVFYQPTVEVGYDDEPPSPRKEVINTPDTIR